MQAHAKNYDSRIWSLQIEQDSAEAKVLLPKLSGEDVLQVRSTNSLAGSLDLETANKVDIVGVLERFDDGIPVIHVASWDDVVIQSRRWTLTPTNLLMILGALSVLLVGIGLLVLILRYQVAARTQALSDLTAQLRASYNSVDAGVVAVGEDGTLLTVNRTANRLLGASLVPGDPADKFIRSWAHRAEDPSSVFEMASAFRSEQEEPSACEVELTDGGGKLRLTLSPINRSGKHIGNLWVMHDETQLQRLQNELFQAQKMDAIGTLAGGIAHDFNNLLTAILGNLNILGLLPPEDEERHKYIGEAESACMSAGELVQQLLGMSRKANMKQKVIDPNDIIQNLKPLLRHGFDSHIEFEFSTTRDLPPVHVDPTQVEQVLLNLCVNARDAMPSGGKISIVSSTATLHDQPAVAISVSDTGYGIPSEIQDKIFRTFLYDQECWQRHRAGIGNIVQRDQSTRWRTALRIND